jgi:hypothetical protein
LNQDTIMKQAARDDYDYDVRIYQIGEKLKQNKRKFGIAKNVLLCAALGVIGLNLVETNGQSANMTAARVVEADTSDGQIHYFSHAATLEMLAGPLAGKRVRVMGQMASQVKPGDCVEVGVYQGRMTDQFRTDGRMLSRLQVDDCKTTVGETAPSTPRSTKP